MRALTLFLVLMLVIGVSLWQQWLPVPPAWNPWVLLDIRDDLTPVTRFKLSRLEEAPALCLKVLENARQYVDLQYSVLPDIEPVAGCPLTNAVRVRRAGVMFDNSFTASCPLTVAWVLFERHRLQPAARAIFGQPVTRVDHYGSFACRNIYDRDEGRRSDHASANALDVAAFRLKDGQRVSIARDWAGQDKAAEFLHRAHDGACDIFGTTLGPEYNAAHEDHFHLGMRGFARCW